jgi:phage terminase large subunit-like protein
MRILRDLIAGTYRDKDGKLHKANDILILGGNGSGKTEIGAKLVVETLLRKSRVEVRAFSQNETTSINYQQPPLHKYLPPSLRSLKKQGGITKISYSVATGFSERVFVLPNGSKCLLFTYKGYEQDRTSAEGGEACLVVNDEPPPAELVRTQRFRAHKANGVLVSTFTPVGGYTEVVAEYLDAAVILQQIPVRRIVWNWPNPWDPKESFAWGEWLLPADRDYVEGCEPGHVPYVLRSRAEGRYVIVFPTVFNPYLTGLEAIIRSALGGVIDFALERLWGWPTKRALRIFPKFSEARHVVPSERIPAEGTNYLLADPHGRRNWFMVWLRVDPLGNWWFYRQWPSADLGEWAVPGDKPDGRAGAGQRNGGGRSFTDYKRLIFLAEGWLQNEHNGAVTRPKGLTELIFERLLDPRPAGVRNTGEDGSQTMIEVLAEGTLDANKVQILPGLDFMPGPASGVKDEVGISFINDLLAHSPDSPPKLFVSRDCPDLIYAFLTWTGSDGEDGATKDPIDCVRMAAKRPCVHYPPGQLGSHGGGSY